MSSKTRYRKKKNLGEEEINIYRLTICPRTINASKCTYTMLWNTFIMTIIEILGGDQSSFRSFQKTTPSPKKKKGSESSSQHIISRFDFLTIDCVDLSLQSHKCRYTYIFLNGGMQKIINDLVMRIKCEIHFSTKSGYTTGQ